MTPEEAASKLDGVEYVHPLEARLREMTPALKQAGLVVAYGASDDLLAFEGAFRDECGAWNGTTVYVDADGVMKSECSEGDDCPYFAKENEGASTVSAVWAPKDVAGDPSWLVTTKIPHAQFRIMEDGGVFGVGIVFKAADAGAKAHT